MATIKDIAKSLNISVSTVSYALNGGPRPVPKKVRDKVLLTAKELGYRPNRTAKSLITGKTRTIGVVPSYLGFDFALSPFFLSSFNGIINQCEIKKYDVILITRNDQGDIESLLNNVLDGRVDGLVFLAPPVNSKAVDLVIENQMPTVVTGHKNSLAASFSVDNRDGVLKGMQYLYGLGHRKIGHLTGMQNLQDSVERSEAFYEFAAKSNLKLNESWVLNGGFNPSLGYENGLQLLGQKERPTAVFCANDESALGLYRASQELGIKIPNDLSVIGFDNANISEFCQPPLTTIAQPLQDIAASAVSSLVDSIEKGTSPQSKLFPTQLIIRDSAASPNK